MSKRLTRDNVPVEQTWDLKDLFQTNESWEQELATLEEEVEQVTQYQGRLHEGAQTLLACLNAHEKLQMRTIRVTTYAHLRSSEDGTNSLYQSNLSNVSAVVAKINAAVSFIHSEILELPDGQVEEYLEHEEGLDTYRKSLIELLETKQHRLSKETETVLASLGEVLDSPFMIYSRSKTSDMDFEPITNENGEQLPVSFALYETRYEQSTNTNERRAAYASFTNTLNQYKNTFAATYATEVKKQVVMSRLRNYDSVEEMLLQPQQVTSEMYNNILDIIQKELAPHMRRLAKLKKRVLGLDKMLLCDLKTPIELGDTPEVSFEGASKIVLEALEIMGPEYMEAMETAINERWVDYADTVGKRSGAFCSSPYGAHPYILMTWSGKMRSAFTLAHELGHAGHFVFANRYQRIHNTRPSKYFIEAPSTLNEMLLSHSILAKTTDPEMRRSVIVQVLGTYYHNFVTHLLEAEMQRRVYRHAESGKPITASVLCQLKGDVLGDFWGDTVEIDEGARLTWMRQPHYYMGLYPYTYAAGLTASTAVAQMIQEEGKPAAERWIEVLKAGGTKKPLDLMKMSGIDMSNPEPIRKAVAFVGSLVDELEKSF
ncbi:oligoendopeptidase F [Anaerobacillus arseniciselenatis]|uniref:Oligopeptidase F n=1 Tax=Anaerobacillus arseniciselenatis TaxID=85682 RepID=A0A1S2LMJ6_9BACI|nr:oligoendopeptidase F [Anaerobacillus arseniciselenatis]OIJ12907.1 oligoendopeptidase F [Anaerobacillus arseniciselenatis]